MSSNARCFMTSTILAGVALVLGIIAAPPALADTAVSSNWSGYAVHRSGVSFRRIQASWTQPTAKCEHGQKTFSSFWVGLGGFSSNSTALEQTGTELDCNAQGISVSSAWYEQVPSPARHATLAVHPGDRMSASVTVTGHQVTLRLKNLTHHKTFSKTLTPSSVDVSSAEWIAEAPSSCVTSNLCRVLPLTDFGAMKFRRSLVVSTRNQRGAISNAAWNRTKIVLSASGPVFPVSTGGSGGATPSALTGSGQIFSVRYSAASGSSASAASALIAAGSSSRVQPGGVRR